MSIFSTALRLFVALFISQTAHAQIWSQDQGTKSITTSPFFNASSKAQLGIGTVIPTDARLVVQGAVGNTIASFRTASTSRGVSLVGDWPGLYFNSYFKGGAKAMAAGYSGIVNFDPDYGRIDLGVSSWAAINPDAPVDLTTRMSINKDGNVGIGTGSPASKLDIAGQDAIRVFGYEPFITLLDNNSYKSARIQTAHGDIAFLKSDPNPGGDFNYDLKMVIKDNGNVAVGAGVADAKFTVNNPDFYKPCIDLEGNHPYMTFRQTSDNEEIGFIRGWGELSDAYGFANNKGLEFGAPPGGGRLAFSTDYARRMNIESNGNVLIGTNYDPKDYKLAVNGKIICTELKVQLRDNWPDYVFANGYKLKPLEEVEQHIKSESHLPGIPAAADLEKEGIEVGEMQRKMMEKIEELTLYVIEINKENKALKQRVEQLESNK